MSLLQSGICLSFHSECRDKEAVRLNLDGHWGKRMDLFSMASPYPQVLLVQPNDYISRERRETLPMQYFTQTMTLGLGL